MQAHTRSSRRPAALAVVTGCAALLLVVEGPPVRLGAGIFALGLGLAALAARPGWGRTASRWAAVASSSCLVLVGADVGLRVAFSRGIYDRPLLNFARRWEQDPAVIRIAPGVRDERTVMGDLTGMLGHRAFAEPRSMRFASDAFGFRNDRLPERPLDVVMLGDSFGMGEGTTQDATWAARLAGRGLEVYNLSFPGSPGVHVLNLAWEARRLPLRRDTVVVWALFSGNDLWEVYPRRDQPAARSGLARLLTSLGTYRDRSPLRLLVIDRRSPQPDAVVVAARPESPPVLFYAPYAARARLAVRELQAEPAYPLLVESFGLMRRQASAAGVRVLVTIVPSKAEVYPELLGGPAPDGPTPFAQVVSALARCFSFDVLDLGPTLQAEAARRGPGGRLLYWRDDTHWNEDGHALAARALEARLAQLRAK